MKQFHENNGASQMKLFSFSYWKWILLIIILLVSVVWYLDQNDGNSPEEDNMSFLNWFIKKNQPSDGLRDYFSALELGDQKNLLNTVVMKEDGSDKNKALIEFAIRMMTVLSDFQDTYGRDAADWANFTFFPRHRVKDVDDAEFRVNGQNGLARMADGYVYHLSFVSNKWRIHWPEFKLKGAVVDEDMARALIVPLTEAYDAIGKDLVTAEEISAKLRDSMNDVLAPFSDRIPKPYNTFPIHNLSSIQSQDVSPALRKALETAYKNFYEAVLNKDHKALFTNSIIPTADREILEKKIKSGDFGDFADWIAMVNPTLDKTSFVTIKTIGVDFAGYYFAWSPSYSNQYQNLSVRQFEKKSNGWKMIYSFSSAFDVPLMVEANENLTDKILEAVETNPILKLKRPDREKAVKRDEPIDTELKDELIITYNTYHQAMLDKDIDAYLANARVSLEDEAHMAKYYKKLFPQILSIYPPLSKTTFVTVRKQGDDLAAYYCIAPDPNSPEFENVIMIPFVRHTGRWKVLFALDTYTYMNLLASKIDGDRISRAFDLIDQQGTILQLESLYYLFEENLIPDDERNLRIALEAIKTEQYEAAVELLKPLSKKGIAKAKSALGLLYSRGNGVRKDHDKAFELYSDAAEQGDSEALYYLGFTYHFGEGVEVDQIWALAYWIAADKLGHEKAEPFIEKATAVSEEEIQIEAKKRASTLLSKIDQRKN